MATTVRTSSVALIRPTTVTAAAVLLMLLGAMGIIAIPYALDEGGVGFAVIGLIVASIRLVAAAGVWRLRRRAARLGFVVTLLDSLVAVPGVFLAPDAVWWVLAITGVVLGVTTLILLAHPASRRVYV